LDVQNRTWPPEAEVLSAATVVSGDSEVICLANEVKRRLIAYGVVADLVLRIALDGSKVFLPDPTLLDTDYDRL
jgi:hypothetical protein